MLISTIGMLVNVNGVNKKVLPRTQISDDRQGSDRNNSIGPNRATISRHSFHPIWKTIVLNNEEIEETQDCYWDKDSKEESHS